MANKIDKIRKSLGVDFGPMSVEELLAIKEAMTAAAHEIDSLIEMKIRTPNIVVEGLMAECHLGLGQAKEVFNNYGHAVVDAIYLAAHNDGFFDEEDNAK